MESCDALHFCLLVFLEADDVLAGKATDSGAVPALGDESCAASEGTPKPSSTAPKEALASESGKVKTANAVDDDTEMTDCSALKQDSPRTALDGALEGSSATLWGILASEVERTDVAENEVGLIKATQRYRIRGNRAKVSCPVLLYGDLQ